MKPCQYTSDTHSPLVTGPSCCNMHQLRRSRCTPGQPTSTLPFISLHPLFFLFLLLPASLSSSVHSSLFHLPFLPHSVSSHLFSSPILLSLYLHLHPSPSLIPVTPSSLSHRASSSFPSSPSFSPLLQLGHASPTCSIRESCSIFPGTRLSGDHLCILRRLS